MQRRTRWVLGVFAALAAGIGALYLRADADVTTTTFNEYGEWQPASASLLEQVESVKPQGLEAQRQKFAALFTSRFRLHEPAKPVRLVFVTDQKIMLKVPARMEPWDADRLVMTAWHETRQAFGHPFDMDVYETYIGAKQIKIGELRPQPGHADQAQIEYDRLRFARQ